MRLSRVLWIPLVCLDAGLVVKMLHASVSGSGWRVFSLLSTLSIRTVSPPFAVRFRQFMVYLIPQGSPSYRHVEGR